jgi:hypothetical protein
MKPANQQGHAGPHPRMAFFRWLARLVVPVEHTTMADELDDTIRQNAQGPARAAGDAGSVEQHKLPDQIEADRYLASKQAARSKRRGLVFNQLVPPGAF